MTCAQLLVFATRSDFLVAGLELHAFVSAFAHRDGDAFIIFVEHLSHRTATTFDALQSKAEKYFSPIRRQSPTDDADERKKIFN